MKKNYRLAGGMYDALPEECYLKNYTEDKIMDCFKRHAFLKLETPTLEYYDLIVGVSGGKLQRKLFKLTDSDGSILVLRPDMTLPVSRVVTTKRKPLGIEKYCYLANSFSFAEENNRDREFTQAGVEIIGGSSALIDADLIKLAVDTLKETGLRDFIIDIGEVGYIKGILNSLHLPAALEKELIALVDKKDMLGVELFARENAIPHEIIDSILNLPTLFGGEEVLQQAEKLAANTESRAAVRNLKAVNEILKETGYAGYVSYDLSLVGGVGYYTGIVFQGMTRYFGANIIGGGRYDSLCNDGKNTYPGAGFAIGIRRLCQALKNQGTPPALPGIDVVIGYDRTEIGRANALIAELVAKGKIVDNTYLFERKKVLAAAKQKQAKQALYVSADGKTEVLS